MFVLSWSSQYSRKLALFIVRIQECCAIKLEASISRDKAPNISACRRSWYWRLEHYVRSCAHCSSRLYRPHLCANTPRTAPRNALRSSLAGGRARTYTKFTGDRTSTTTMPATVTKTKAGTFSPLELIDTKVPAFIYFSFCGWASFSKSKSQFGQFFKFKKLVFQVQNFRYRYFQF